MAVMASKMVALVGPHADVLVKIGATPDTPRRGHTVRVSVRRRIRVVRATLLRHGFLHRMTDMDRRVDRAMACREDRGVDRRAFLCSVSSFTVARHLSQHTAGAMSRPTVTTLRVTNGTTQLEAIRDQHGWGLGVRGTQPGAGVLATAAIPIRVFYETRGTTPVTEVRFSSVRQSGPRLVATADFTDARDNRWRVQCVAERVGRDGIACHYEYELVAGDADGVFFEHAFTPEMPGTVESTYVLMPGVVYDGNHLTRTPRQIQQLTDARQFQVETPVLSLAIPVSVSYEKHSGRTFMLFTEPTTSLGMNGITYILRPEAHRVIATTPGYWEERFRRGTFRPEAPQGATVRQGERVHVSMTCVARHYADLLDMFTEVHAIRTLGQSPFVRTPRVPLVAAASLVQQNLNQRMWCESSGFYCNAMPPEFDLHAKGCTALPPDWQLQTGWCAGSATGYALLKLGDPLSRARTIRMLDLIAEGGTSPSGLLWSLYANDRWDPQVANDPYYQHLRMPADGAFFFQKAIAIECARGIQHPTWEALVVHNLDAFVTLWQRHGQFGHTVDRETLTITDPDTAAGALCIGGLALGHRLARGKEYLHIAETAADAFFDRYVRTGWIVGGPLDIPNAPDSESVFALVESYVTLYEVTKTSKYLRYARAVLDQLATWVVAYNAPFPPDTFGARNGIQTVGGVLANAQNHHIGPSFCTHSGDALLRLYEHTGDPAALRLLEDVMGSLLQYVCTGKEIGYTTMQPGMVTEQFNISDEIRPRGAIWEICTSWAATCVLLSAGELPSVYVDAVEQRLAVFDHLTVVPHWRQHSLVVHNPTTYPAEVTVRRRGGMLSVVHLAAGEHHVMAV